MKISRQMIQATLCVSAISGGLQAQQTIAGVPPALDKNVAFQYFSTSDAMQPVRIESFSAKPVTGKPFSATEVRKTHQTLGDGTHIDKVEKDKFYRDFDGRTRVEREDGASVMISDPANGTAREAVGGRPKIVMMRSGTFTQAIPAERGIVHDRVISVPPPIETQVRSNTKEMLDKVKTELAVTGVAPGASFGRAMIAPAPVPDQGVTEDLGDQMINGVRARGTRSTITIPVGQIGNDREIRVVSERWFSEDLGVLIKSSNNDPRFGETTFELTDILQGAQDPTLFEMPAPKHP